MGNNHKRKNMKREKNYKRDALTYKIIGDNKEVIIVENAVEYVKKMGYKVISPLQIATIYTFTAVFLVISSLIILRGFR